MTSCLVCGNSIRKSRCRHCDSQSTDLRVKYPLPTNMFSGGPRTRTFKRWRLRQELYSVLLSQWVACGGIKKDFIVPQLSILTGLSAPRIVLPPKRRMVLDIQNAVRSARYIRYSAVATDYVVEVGAEWLQQHCALIYHAAVVLILMGDLKGDDTHMVMRF